MPPTIQMCAPLQLKQIVGLFKCSVCVFKVISLRDCDRDYRITTDSYTVPHTVDSLNVNHETAIKKSKAILHHVDIFRRYFFVCQLKIVFYFSHELKQRSSDVTGRRF